MDFESVGMLYGTNENSLKIICEGSIVQFFFKKIYIVFFVWNMEHSIPIKLHCYKECMKTLKASWISWYVIWKGKIISHSRRNVAATRSCECSFVLLILFLLSVQVTDICNECHRFSLPYNIQGYPASLDCR